LYVLGTKRTSILFSIIFVSYILAIKKVLEIKLLNEVYSFEVFSVYADKLCFSRCQTAAYKTLGCPSPYACVSQFRWAAAPRKYQT